MQVNSTSECSIGAFCYTFDLPNASNTFDLHLRLLVLKTYFWASMEWLLKTSVTVIDKS